MSYSSQSDANLQLPAAAAEVLGVPETASPEVLLGCEQPCDPHEVTEACRVACARVRASGLPHDVQSAAESVLVKARSLVLATLEVEQRHARAHDRALTTFDRQLLGLLRGGWTPRTRRRAMGLAARHGLPPQRLVPVLHGMAAWLRAQRMGDGASSEATVRESSAGRPGWWRGWMVLLASVLLVMIIIIVIEPSSSPRPSVNRQAPQHVGQDVTGSTPDFTRAPVPTPIPQSSSTFVEARSELRRPHHSLSRARVYQVGRRVAAAESGAQEALVALLQRLTRDWSVMEVARQQELVPVLAEMCALVAADRDQLIRMLQESQHDVDADAWTALMQDIVDGSDDPVVIAAIATMGVSPRDAGRALPIVPTTWSHEVGRGDPVWSATWAPLAQTLTALPASTTLERLDLLWRSRLANEAALSIALGADVHPALIGRLTNLAKQPVGADLSTPPINSGDMPGAMGLPRGMQGVASGLQQVRNTIGPLDAATAQTAARVSLYGDLRPRTSMQSQLLDRRANEVLLVRSLLDAPLPLNPPGDVRRFLAAITDDASLEQASSQWHVAAAQSLMRRALVLEASARPAQKVWAQWNESLQREASMLGVADGPHPVAAARAAWIEDDVVISGDQWSFRLEHAVRERRETWHGMAEQLGQSEAVLDLSGAADAVDQLLQIERAIMMLWSAWFGAGQMP